MKKTKFYSVHTSVLNDVPVLGWQGEDDGEAMPDPQEIGGQLQPREAATRGSTGPGKRKR
jgi:hypothetical protein